MVNETRVEHRFAVIMCADVVGYSRLMGIDEEGTLAALQAVRRELVDARIGEHKGRIVRAMGDGLLVEFGSVLDAVRCALAIQQAMPEHGAATAADQTHPAAHRDQHGRRRDRRRPHSRRGRHHRRADGEPGRAGWDQCQPRGARPGARPAADRLRGSGRAQGGAHRAPGPRLPNCLGRRAGSRSRRPPPNGCRPGSGAAGRCGAAVPEFGRRRRGRVFPRQRRRGSDHRAGAGAVVFGGRPQHQLFL